MFSSAGARVLLLTAPIAAFAAWGGLPLSNRSVSQVDGRALASALGCGGCHDGLPSPDLARRRAPALGPGATPLPADFVFDYLAAPSRRRIDIGATRMPDFRLDEGVRIALALFLGTGTPSGAAAAAVDRHPQADSGLGGRLFTALGCNGCHTGIEDGDATGIGPDLSREGVRVRPDWLRKFLHDPLPIRRDGHPGGPGARMPDFRLSEDEVGALVDFLGGLGSRFAVLEADPLTPSQTARTRRLLENRLACLGCHELRGEGGHIGPSFDGLGSRLEESFVLEMIQDPGRAAPGSPMPTQPLSERDARRIARYILDSAGSPLRRQPASLAQASHPAWASGDPGSGEPAALYARHCESCHGSGGAGDGWNAPLLPLQPTAHADSALMAKRTDDTLFDGIHAGAWVLDGSSRMPPFGGLLSAGEIRSLVSHIRELCSCEGPAWSRDGPGGGR